MSTAQLTAGDAVGYNQDMETFALYSPEDLLVLEKKKRLTAAALAVIAGGGLVTCVVLCLCAGTANADVMEKATIAVSVIAGWVCLYLRRFSLADARHEIDHARMLLHGEGEIFTGVLTVTKERLRITNSIRIRIVTLDRDGKTMRLKVIESRAARLEALNGRRVRVSIVNGYIAGAAAL